MKPKRPKDRRKNKSTTYTPYWLLDPDVRPSKLFNDSIWDCLHCGEIFLNAFEYNDHVCRSVETTDREEGL